MLKTLKLSQNYEVFLRVLICLYFPYPQRYFFQGMNDFPGRSIQPQRAASLSRFREKRKERCFDKKIRYSVRKEVALRYYIFVSV